MVMPAGGPDVKGREEISKVMFEGPLANSNGRLRRHASRGVGIWPIAGARTNSVANHPMAKTLYATANT